MTEPVFLYGTLCDPELYQIVAGAPLEARVAELPEASVYWVAGESYPILAADENACAVGLLVSPDTLARARLDFYELGFGYDVERKRVTTETGDVTAAVYVPKSEWPLGAPWNLAEWQSTFGPLSRLAADEFMKLIATHEPDAAVRAFPTIRMRAASRLRALNDPSPEALDPMMSGTKIVPERTEQPYTDYFAIREDWLTFPKFDGNRGEVVKRATFMGGDAVTVLPYDPKTENVMIIRQFRHGPYSRGDTNPWALEPAAGRIDPNETPEHAAQRELLEETEVIADTLHFVGRYYPSPGAVSEYLYSFVAVADLSGLDQTVGGLVDEAEDIMRHVLPLDEALALIATGAANTGPLILSLMWLAMNKGKLG